MSSEAQANALRVASNGVDYAGFAQPQNQAITANFARYSGPRWDGKTIMNKTAHGLVDGQPIIIVGSTNYNGATRVRKVLNANQFIINKNYVSADVAGNFSVNGGEGAWTSFRPIGTDLLGANVVMTFWDSRLNTGAFNPSVVAYQRDWIYNFPGIIKTIQITTAGNIQLYRNPTLRPWGKDAV